MKLLIFILIISLMLFGQHFTSNLWNDKEIKEEKKVKNKIKIIIEWILVMLCFIIFIGTLVSPIIIAIIWNNPWFLFLWFVIGPIAIAELWLITSLWGLYFEGFYRYKS